MRGNNTRARNSVRRKSSNKPSIFVQKLKNFSLIVVAIALFYGLCHHYRNGLAYYFGFKSHKISHNKSKDKRVSDARNFQILESYDGNSMGIDVSEFQDNINWSKVKNIEEDFLIDFVFIRATAGNDRADKKFEYNWRRAKEKQIIRGAYHYYRPNENSLEQAQLFIKTVRLKEGDLPPILDIEKMPRGQSMDSLKIGLRRWLVAVENHYNVKPIIYTSEKYYDDFLKNEFSDYLFWIANYNFYREKIGEDWLFWQFTEKASVSGIKGNVDVNIFNGDKGQLENITIE